MEDLFWKFLPPFIVGFAVTGSLAYFSEKAKAEISDGQLRYGLEFKAFGWLSFAIALSVIFVMIFVDHGGQYVSLALLAALFSILGTWLLLESYATKGYFDNQQITISSLWTRSCRAQWAELREARFKQNGQYFEFVFSDGTKIQLSKMLRGHRQVCQYVESLGFTIRDIDKA